MYEIEERKSHIFSIKFQMYNLYIHNLSAMKLTNCVEIKLSAPPTAKCDLQLLFKYRFHQNISVLKGYSCKTGNAPNFG